jgi:hypothetical protein
MRLTRILSALFLLAASTTAAGFRSHDRSQAYAELRLVIDRTQTDLRAASDVSHGDKQRARYQHAQDDLSKLDRKLVKGKFDKEAFSQSLNAIKKILDHNTLQSSGRDALMQDLSALEAAHERH